MVNKKRLIPTGTCWCGCREEAPIGAFFLRGHDKKAESKVIKREFETVAGFLDALGYAPGGPKARYLSEK